MNTENAFRAAGCFILFALVSFALYVDNETVQTPPLSTEASVEVAAEQPITL